MTTIPPGPRHAPPGTPEAPLSRRWRSLKFRIALLVSVLALASALLAAGAALQPMRHQIREMIGAHEVALLASTAAALDQEIQAKRQVLRAIAEGREARGGDAEGVQRLIERHAVLREQFDNVLAFDVTGQIIANLSDSRATGDRFGARSAMLRGVVASGEGAVSSAYRSPLTGKPTILLAEPVKGTDGRTAFVLGGALRLDNPRFIGTLEASKPGRSAYYVLLDSRGTVVHHPRAERVLLNVAQVPSAIGEITRQGVHGWEGWAEGRTAEGEPALIAATHLRRTGWTLVIVYPVREALGPLYDSEASAWLAVAFVTLLAGMLGTLLTTRLLRPLKRLQGRVEMLSAGTAGIDVLDSARPDEVGRLSRAFYLLSRQRQEAEQRLALLTRTDTLTGLNNRRMFEAELPAALARARRQHRALALAFFDIDHFKQINDTHGHATGDLVLIEFARRLAATVRAVDIVARLSGDEFVILFERVDEVAAVEPMVVKLLAAIRQPFPCPGRHLAVTTTVGVALAPGDVAPEQLLKAADDALYEAKAAGRDTWSLRVLTGHAGDPPDPGDERKAQRLAASHGIPAV